MKHESIKGVNLGGWLLLERWMTPSVFEGTDAQDEYTLSQLDDASRRIDQHRKNFMKEEDWRWLADHGITHVRLPVGYWVLDDDAPYMNARIYLDWAFKMAEKYSLHILLDLHGLKGSQNAEMHSGRIGKVAWKKYLSVHLKVLARLAERYKNSPAFWGLEVINEPKVWGNYFALLRYYREAYALLRNILRPGTYFVFHDGFLPPLFSGAVYQRKNFPVLMDTHFYGLFPDLLKDVTPSAYDVLRKYVFSSIIWLTQLVQPVIVGEWSAVLPQTFFDRIAKDKHLVLVGQTISRQRRMYRHAFATFYWNYKTEGRGMFHYRSLVEDHIIS